MDITPYSGSACPVCGAPAEVVVGGAGFDAYCTVRCTRCGMSVTRVNKDDDYCEYEEHAQAAWEGARAKFCPLATSVNGTTSLPCSAACAWFDGSEGRCAVMSLRGISNALGFIGMTMERQ